MPLAPLFLVYKVKEKVKAEVSSPGTYTSECEFMDVYTVLLYIISDVRSMHGPPRRGAQSLVFHYRS